MTETHLFYILVYYQLEHNENSQQRQGGRSHLYRYVKHPGNSIHSMTIDLFSNMNAIITHCVGDVFACNTFFFKNCISVCVLN